MIKTALRPYQLEAVEKAKPFDGFALFMEQRTGKTLTALALVDFHRPPQLLIICPKRALKVWASELRKHLDADWDMDVLLVNYEQIIDPKRRKALRQHCMKADTFTIVDESHRIKRRGSKQSRACRTLGAVSSWRLALTGTPIAQGLHDAWAQFDFLDPLIFGNWASFEGQYCLKGGFKGRQIIGYRNQPRFERLFHKYSYRKTLKEVQERPVMIRRIVRQVQLEPDALQAYQDLERDLITTVRQRTIETPLVITLVMKLQQITGGFLIDEDGDALPIGTEKLEELEKVLTATPGRVVICCRFRHELEAIANLLNRLGKSHFTIAGGTEWDGTFETDAALLQVQSGVAIDLSSADLIVFYSWDYSYINYEQTRFRVLSYQRTRVTYVYLMAEDTIDQQIYEAVTRKKNLATLVCDHYRRR